MNKEIAIKWYKQARHDLEMAEKNISIKGYDITAFLCHQAVEKLFKALIALQGAKIPKTHYIDELGRLLDINESILSQVLDLTADYTLARYPDVHDIVPYEEYDERTAQEKVKKAKGIFYYFKKHIKLDEIK
ncbi:MAG: HEPN domain-containing protein [Spirochaetales bacterium]|nr:HEPN domain-containing protein [Spirochaetales bacterium]